MDKYIQSVIQKNADELMKDHTGGTCLVQFIVDTHGSVSDIKAITMQNSRLAEVAINAIRQGPRWNPAKQNGNPVSSYKRQAVTFKIADDNIEIKNEPR
ncbi:MAG: energy transducer TonB [Ginsengibacter sp.]